MLANHFVLNPRDIASTVSMYQILFALWILSATASACFFLMDDSKPKGLEERALDAEVVLAAYTRAVYKSHKNSSTKYSAEFLVFNVLKGEEHVIDVYQKRKPSSLETALNRRLVNASNFGDGSRCQSDVKAGETYILFLDVEPDGHLTSRYDGAYGPAVIYSRDKEVALEAIGVHPWSEWSPCSGNCGGGIQQRKRQCDDPKKCDDEDGQQRTCNMFTCAGTVNILEEAGVHRSALRPFDRPTAYKLLPSGSWRSMDEEVVFPRTFPWEFSLLVTVRIKTSSSAGFLLRILHTGSLQVGLYLSDTLTLVLSDKDKVRVSFVKSLSDDHWHQLAFSVRRNTVSFYLNCEFSGKLPIPGKIKPFGGQPATVVVGSTGRQELDAFRGDVEQITITGSPDDAERQCNATIQQLNIRTGSSPSKEEVRSRPFSSSSTQNDQLPLRGDIIDDEDFSFEDTGSGLGDTNDDDDYEDEKTKKDQSEKEKIPLKAENEDSSEEAKSGDDSDSKSDEDSSEDEKDEDSSEEESNEDEEDQKSNHSDEEPDSVEDDEGSGSKPESELAWSEWSPCSTTCNWGRRSRTSYCLDNGLNLESCNEASSKRSETEACFVRLCPISTSTVTIFNTPVTSTPILIPVKLECKVKCQNGGTCLAPKSCHCAAGFYGDLCQFEKQSCKVNCRNGGTCQPPWTCICEKGFFGNECQYGCGQPCLKGVHCPREENCKCPPGYIPPTCTALCKPRCLNGGACVAPNKCRCKPGYVGLSCHKAICEQGCKNGGECIAPNKCNCRSGFTGKDCGKPLCDPMCQNGGDCVKPYFCHCPPGTRGALCEKLQCKPDCRNGGICIGAGRCSCPRGYSGYSCEQAYCPGGCKNGGKCGKTGKCSCLLGFSGIQCEIKKPCKYVEVKTPFKRSYKQRVTTQVKVSCGAWGWKLCTKTKVHYEMVYKTFFRTSYECEGATKDYPEYRKMLPSSKLE